MPDANIRRVGANGIAFRPEAFDVYNALVNDDNRRLVNNEDMGEYEAELLAILNDDEISQERYNATLEKYKNEMKKRHLTQNERRALHQPKPDFVETPNGEVLKNINTVVVSDIIKKYNK